MKEDQDAMEIALREEKERQESSFKNAFWKRSSKDKEEDKEEDELATALRPFQNHFASTASSLPKVSSSNVEQTQRRDDTFEAVEIVSSKRHAQMQEIIANDGSERDVRGDGAVRGDCGWIRGRYDTVGRSAHGRERGEEGV